MQLNIKAIVVFFVVVVLAIIGYNHYSVKKSEEQRAQMQAKIDATKADLERRELEKQRELALKNAPPAQPTTQSVVEAPQSTEQTTNAVQPTPVTDVEIGEINADEVEKAYQIEQLELLYSKWQDGDALAQSTARIALSNPVKNLQDIKREVQGLKVHSCLAPHKSSLVIGMDEIINGYYQFMQEEGEMASALAFLARQKGEPFLKEFEQGIKRCK